MRLTSFFNWQNNLPDRLVAQYILFPLLAASMRLVIDYYWRCTIQCNGKPQLFRSEEHTSELQSLMRISYAVFCLKKKKQIREYISYTNTTNTHITHKT